MKYPSLIAAAVALVAAPFAFAEAKAYENVNYAGKGAGVTVTFVFASGYPEASKLTITTTGKPMKFRYNSDADEAGKMHFVPATGDAKAEVILKMGSYDDPAAKVEGTYTAGG